MQTEIYPNLSKCWDKQRNNISADKVSFGTMGSYFFVCEDCGTSHSMVLTTKTRQYEKTNKCLCRKCSKKIGTRKSKETYIENLKTGKNLQALYPELTEYWDYKTNELNPNEVSFASNKKVYFICSDCGVSHAAQICNKTRQLTLVGRCLCKQCSAKNAGLKRKKQ